MRKYSFSVSNLVNQLMPHFLGGRKLVLFVQAILSPLQDTQEKWEQWAYEKRMEAAMTSQVILFEYFLTYKLRKYFADSTQRITITDGTSNGLVMYWERAESPEDVIMRQEGELKGVEPQAVLRYENEQSDTSAYSFIINCPAINTDIISTGEVRNIISYWTDRYRIAGKTYNIKFI